MPPGLRQCRKIVSLSWWTVRYQVEHVHLGQDRGRIAEAEAGVRSVPRWSLAVMLHINHGASMAGGEGLERPRGTERPGHRAGPLFTIPSAMGSRYEGKINSTLNLHGSWSAWVRCPNFLRWQGLGRA